MSDEPTLDILITDYLLKTRAAAAAEDAIEERLSSLDPTDRDVAWALFGWVQKTVSR